MKKVEFNSKDFYNIQESVLSFLKEYLPGYNFIMITYDMEVKKVGSVLMDQPPEIAIDALKHVIKRFTDCITCEHKSECKAFINQNMNLDKICKN